MAIRMLHLATLSSICGVVSFIVGIVAENMKPDSGTPVQGKGVTICHYSSGSSQYVVMGFVSLGFLALSALVGFASLSYSYNKKAIPRSSLYSSPTMKTFFHVAMLWTAFGASFILWPTLTQFFHQTKNVHGSKTYTCPTAKTGLLGGGSLLSFCASLLWLVCMMLANNAREDYFEELEESRKDERTQVINLEQEDLPSVSQD